MLISIVPLVLLCILLCTLAHAHADVRGVAAYTSHNDCHALTQALEAFVLERADLVRFCEDEFRRRQCVLGAKFDATG